MDARLRVEGVLVELVPTTDPDLLCGRGNGRLALATSQIEVAVQDLRARAVFESEVRAVEDGRLASLNDLDDNGIVLWQYARHAGTGERDGRS